MGYEHLMPQALLDSGHEIVLVPPPEPVVYVAPTPPEMPADREPIVWRSSTSKNRVVRVLTNRTVNQLDYLLRSWANRHSDAYRAYMQADREYHKRLAHPFLYFDWQANEALVEAVVNTHADIVQAVDLPSLDTAWQASQRLHSRLVYAAHELWVGFVRNPDFNAQPFEAAGLLAVERRRIHDADLITVTSDTMGERLIQIYGIHKPLTILNSPPERVETPRPVSEPVRLVYHGGLSNDRNIDGLIRAVALMGDRVTLDIHGFSRTVDLGALANLAEELGLADTVRFHGAFEYADVVDLLSGYDVGVMTAKVIEENFEVTLPNKVFDCMCAGLAVAMYDSPAVRAVLAEVPFGITLDPSSPVSIARDLEPLVSDPDRIAQMKSAAVTAAHDYWWPAQGQALVDAFAHILKRRRVS
ncbi:MAG: glycosyltransferase family 4 protein [Coriobacteriia bacterium]|nr:glycosyltransferase family 4 protein [Coriobacteriia bacterium]